MNYNTCRDECLFKNYDESEYLKMYDDYYNCWDYDEIKDEYNITESDFNTIEDRFYKLIDDSNKNGSEFVKDIISMNQELTKYGYANIEYYRTCDDTEIIDYIKDYENKYLENGDVFDE